MDGMKEEEQKEEDEEQKKKEPPISINTNSRSTAHAATRCYF